MKQISIGYILLLSLSLGSCSSDKGGDKQQDSTATATHDPEVVEFTASQYRSAGIQLGNMENKNLTDYVKASGNIEVPPQQVVSITSPYGGNIKDMSVLEGKFISKGQVVAVLENPEFVQLQQDFMESSSQLSFLKQDLDRQEELVKENIAARKSLQRAQSDYNAMTARVQGLRAKLRIINLDPEKVSHGDFTSRVNINAPQDGFVTKVYANIGKFIGPNEIVADIANTSSMMVRARIFEKDVKKISLGQIIRFKPTGDSTEQTAKIFIIGKDIHEDRTVDIQAKIDKRAGRQFPGMFVNVIIELGAAATPALPQEAVVQSGGKSYIFVEAEKDAKAASDSLASYSFRRIEVGIGVTENGYSAVVLPENLDRQSRIVVKGAYDLLSKMKNTEEQD